jgi:hypothetical protein
MGHNAKAGEAARRLYACQNYQRKEKPRPHGRARRRWSRNWGQAQLTSCLLIRLRARYAIRYSPAARRCEVIKPRS